jgi:hypothetical protein
MSIPISPRPLSHRSRRVGRDNAALRVVRVHKSNGVRPDDSQVRADDRTERVQVGDVAGPGGAGGQAHCVAYAEAVLRVMSRTAPYDGAVLAQWLGKTSGATVEYIRYRHGLRSLIAG